MYLNDEEKARPQAEKSRPKRSHLIPDAELERLKRDIDLVALVRSYGVELKASGKDFVGRCPFHDDTHASLVISPDKNLWHCMGECNMGGTTIDWVMRMEKVGFRHAVEILRERVGANTTAKEGENDE
jgi:DNA primase